MTRFQRHAHRARERLIACGRLWPQAWALIDEMRAQHAQTWPPYVYLTLPAASAALTEHRRRIGMPPPQRGGMIGSQAADAALLAGMASWRMTQSIYRYDPALYDALVDTPLAGDVPTHMLRRLPEWCVYAETPSMLLATADGGTVPAYGVWAWLDRDERIGADHDLLLLLWDTDLPSPTCTALPLVGTLDASVDEVMRGWAQSHADGATDTRQLAGLRDAYWQCVPPVLSLLLYLCSEAPDLTRRGRPDMPKKPESKRTRRDGWRLFPADGPREWDVGVRIGAALRAAYQRDQTGGDAAPTGRHVRPHVRRAHWHTVLSGPRKRGDGTEIPSAERHRDLRWMPPVAINVDDLDVLPAVVRTVR